MKYFEVNYLAKGKRNKTVIKAVNKLEALNIAKSNIAGTILKNKRNSDTG